MTDATSHIKARTLADRDNLQPMIKLGGFLLLAKQEASR
jgi:hypothetical protein